MSIQSLTSTSTLRVLKPQTGQGASLGAKRVFVVTRTVSARVKPVSADDVFFYAQHSMEVDHNLWFSANPNLTEADMLSWTTPDGVTILMRVTRVPVDLHGLGRIWMGGGMAYREDNIEFVTPETPLT